MGTKLHKQIYIEPHQEARLKQLARQEGVSQAEIIRRAIDGYICSPRQAQPDLNAWEKERAFIRGLMQQGPVPGRRTWQRENLHVRAANPFAAEFQMERWV